MNEILVSKEAYKALEEKLKYLKGVRRKEVADKIEFARSYGDLSENSEYKSAMEEQDNLEREIANLEQQYQNCKIIKTSAVKTDEVQIGSVVKVLEVEFDEESVYTIVGAIEGDPTNNKISNVSPVGKALMGHKKGDVVKVHTPNGTYDLKILSVK